jgi:hypothetical protein
LPGSNGSIMPVDCAMRRIHLSDLINAFSLDAAVRCSG